MAALAVLFCALGASTPAASAPIPPDASFRGHTYTDLEVRWWQNALSIPADQLLAIGGPFAGPDGILFLAGVPIFSGVPNGPTTLDVTISKSTALFFPIINAECSVAEGPPFHGDDEASLRACANGHIDTVTGLFATIDGDPVGNLSSFRIESPLFQYGPLPAGNALGLPPGTTSPAVDAGYYLLLPPFGTGTHELHFGGTLPAFEFAIDTTYQISVVPEPSNFALLGATVLGLLAGAYGRKSVTGHRGAA